MNSLEQETKLPVINNDLAFSSFEDKNWMNFPLNNMISIRTRISKMKLYLYKF